MSDPPAGVEFRATPAKKVHVRMTCATCTRRHMQELIFKRRIGRGAYSDCWLVRVGACKPVAHSKRSAERPDEEAEEVSKKARGDHKEHGPAAKDVKVPAATSARFMVVKLLKLDKVCKGTDTEPRIHRTLAHSSILKFHLTFQLHDTPVYLLDFCSGGTLAERVQTTPTLPLATIFSYFRQLTSAVQYLHAQGIVHRDIKPTNVLLHPESKDTVKLCDFGLAVRWTDGDAPMKQLSGTPNYFAPEMLTKTGYTSKVDVWALGCTLYFTFTARPMFVVAATEDKKESRRVLCEAIKTEPVPELPPFCPSSLKKLWGRMVNKNPRRRISITQVVSRLLKLPVPSYIAHTYSEGSDDTASTPAPKTKSSSR